MLEDFKKFLLRGNLIDLAIGFSVGAAFSNVARSLVSDVLMPPVGLLLGNADFSDLFIVIRAGETVEPPYTTLAEAQAAGAITLNYGIFINNILSLIIVAFAMYFLIKLINHFEDHLGAIAGKKKGKSEKESSVKKCPFCFTTIDQKATRCPACTSQLKAWIMVND